jgi:glycosyltransferase involved in cell wall biosynthesis
MRVSVIVPLFNKAGYIRRSLDSIAAQTLRDFEVIVVDDGSTDGGDRIAGQYPDPRFRLVRQPNAGPGAARNRGIAEARAPYLAFLDADDVWLPEFLATNIRLLDRYPSAVCASGAWIDFPGGVSCVPVFGRRGISEGILTVSPLTPVRIFDAMVSFMTPSMTVVRAEALRRHGGFHEAGCRFAEDGVLWLKLLLNEPVYFHLLPLTEFHREASGLSNNYTGPRPVEPYLSDPESLRRICPAALRPLLDRFYAARACKTACMLGYWGDWRRARALLTEFVSLRDWRTPYFGFALAASTPAGALAGRIFRVCRPPLEPAAAVPSVSKKAAAAGK